MTTSPTTPDDGAPQINIDTLVTLEKRVEQALATGDQRGLTVLGYGEISSVLRAEEAGVRYACKRLPPFANESEYSAYVRSVHDYITALAAHGVVAAPSEIYRLPSTKGRIIAYMVQREYPTELLAHKFLATASPEQAHALMAALIVAINGAADPIVGLDAGVTNWIWRDDKLIFVDINTPMLRDSSGEDLLDTELFLRSVPVTLRWVVRSFFLKDILDKFHEPRRVFLDFLAMLIQQKLDRYIPVFLPQINATISVPLTEADVRAYHKEDADTWKLIQRFRNVERVWRSKVMRKSPEFLLPPALDRGSAVRP